MFDVTVLELFARAGGGGSGGGGGGGGGGDGGLFALPFVAAAGIGGFVKKKTQSKLAAFWVGMAAAALASLPYIFWNWFIFLIAFAGGIGGAFTGAFADKLGKFRANSKAAEAAVQRAAAGDTMWDPNYVTNYATQVFNRFQYDWSNFDTESIRQYTTQRYSNHVGLMLYAMQQMGRKNIMDGIQINEVIFSGAHDDQNNQGDRVSVAFLAQAHDQLIDTAANRTLTTTNEEFGEQWNFVREGNAWKLDSIDQATEDQNMLVQSLKQFAAANQMYFSPDWGRLLLPTRGQLFKNGFKNADINNHVIGFWTGELLVQLYTYNSGKDDDVTHYMVGQINLPKSYGGILVERRNKVFNRLKAPSGYKKVTLEWGDFNQRYNVYATDENQVTSFELLNPSFMAWLYDQDLKVNIEVVDNVVYLYSKISANERRYTEMLEILRRSHKELKM